MRLVIITQNSLIIQPLLACGYDVAGIVEAAPRKLPNMSQKFIYGTLMRMRHIVGHRIFLRSLAKELGLPYFYLDKGQDNELARWLTAITPDVIVVHSMSRLLKENIFALPKHGTINIHPSYLPYYRGPNPHFWEYYDNSAFTGVTVHFIDKGEDTGDIICQAKIAISPGESLSDLTPRINEASIKLLLDALDHIQNGSVKRVQQTVAAVTCRARVIALEEYNNLINWNDWSVERVWHFLRGTTEYLQELTDMNMISKLAAVINVLNYQRTDTSGRKKGYVRCRHNHIVVCRDGIITLNIRLSALKAIKNLLRRAIT